jgi:hypothetical protein
MEPISEEKPKQTVQESVLENIRRHKVSMRSKKYFVLQTLLLAVGVVVVFLAIIYLASFVVFGLSETGLWFTPHFGLRGWFIFFRSLPWVLILLTLVFALILEIMVRRYSFAYRRPLLYSMLGIVGLVLIGGFLISRSRFHHQFRQYGRERHIPMVGGFYRRFGTPHFREVHQGVIQEILPSGFVLELEGGETSTVIFTPQTRFFQGKNLLASDTVVVFGDEDDRIIKAEGVRRISR